MELTMSTEPLLLRRINLIPIQLAGGRFLYRSEDVDRHMGVGTAENQTTQLIAPFEMLFTRHGKIALGAGYASFAV